MGLINCTKEGKKKKGNIYDGMDCPKSPKTLEEASVDSTVMLKCVGSEIPVMEVIQIVGAGKGLEGVELENVGGEEASDDTSVMMECIDSEISLLDATQIVEGKNVGDGAVSMFRNMDSCLGCPESGNAHNVDDAVAQTPSRTGNMGSHQALADRRVEKGVKGKMLVPERGINKGITVWKGMEKCNASQLKTFDSPQKVEVFGDDISIFVDFCGPPNELVLKNEAANGLGLAESENRSKLKIKKEGNGGSDERECNFAVGDIVWIKTKKDSWWPGWICDPSCLSVPQYPADCPSKDCLLVGYMGNGRFSWRPPPQLKPFTENFEKMWEESKHRNFVAAVEKALREIGRRIKLNMTCACMLKENQIEVAAELTSNGMGNCGNIGKHSVICFEPENFLKRLKFLSLELSMPSMLELTTVQHNLSAFYSSLGHCQLPMQLIQRASNADNSTQNSLLQNSDTDDCIEFQNSQPSTESLLLKPLHDQDQSTDFLLLPKQPGDSEDEVLRRDENEDLLMASTGTTESKHSSLETEDGGMEWKIEKSFESRDRKKSKYLSYPYINMNSGRKNIPVSGDHSETEDIVAPKAGDEVLDMSLAADQGSESPVKNGTKKRKKLSDRSLSTADVQEMANASSSELLSELQLAARVCLYSSDCRQFESIEGFVSAFRSSVYHECSEEILAVEPSSVETHAEEIPHSLAAACKSEQKKRLKKAMASLLNAQGELDKRVPHAIVDDDSDGDFLLTELAFSIPGINEITGKLKSNQKMNKKKEQNVSMASNTLPGAFFDVPARNSVIIDFQTASPLEPSSTHEKNKCNKDGSAGSSQTKLQTLGGMLDLNGNTDITGLPPLENTQDISFGPLDANVVSARPDLNENTGIADLSPVKNNQDITFGQPDVNDINARPDSNGKITGRPPVKNNQNIIFGPPDVNDIGTRLDWNGNTGIAGLLQVNNGQDMTFGSPDFNPRPDLNGGTGVVGLPLMKNCQDITFGPPDVNDISAKPDLNGSNGIAGPPLVKKSQDIIFSPPDVTNISAEPTPKVNDPVEMISFSMVASKNEVRKGKTKVKATSEQPKTKHAGGNEIPDLNGRNNQLDSFFPDINCMFPPMKHIPRKKRKKVEATSRRAGKKSCGIREASRDHGKVGGNVETLGGDALLLSSKGTPLEGTALLLAFTPGYPRPSKESLVETFRSFGPLKESQTRVLEDSGSARVVFERSCDAGEAFRSLEKSSPFGPALANYRLHNHAGASRVLELDKNGHMQQSPLLQQQQQQHGAGLVVPVIQARVKPQIVGGKQGPPSLFLRKVDSAASKAPEVDENGHALPATPHVTRNVVAPVKPTRLNPQNGDDKGPPPPLVHVRQKLKMMTSMLEKSGDNLSPEMRAQLENQINGLMKKVSTMDGGGGSSA